jgi:hypothetical protein
MTSIAELAERIRLWTMPLPLRWGLGHIEIHSSLFITLPALAIALSLLSIIQASMAELSTAAVTLPMVWLASLIVRVAAQQLAIGSHASQFETVVGPAGNLSTDYERLDGPVIFSYAMAGQVATAALILLGFVVSAAIAPLHQTAMSFSELFDFKCGWTSHAWASQILWVNLFIGSLHMLPTVPFDMRALVYSTFKIRHRRVTQSQIYQTLGSLDSHFACMCLGAGAICAALEWGGNELLTGWYGFLAAAAYLFVGGRWEATRATEIDEQLASHKIVRVTRRDPAHIQQPDLHLSADEEPASNSSYLEDSTESHVPRTGDIDEILRKLHREGQGALSLSEREALLSASRQLQEKRNRP